MDKQLKLEYNLREYASLAVAFSGGVDSTYLLYEAHRILGDNALAISVVLKGTTKEEIDFANDFCREHDIAHITVKVDEINDITGFKENPKDRCYVCKSFIFKKIIEEAKKSGITHVADGSNYDDISDYRPGMRALKELSVVSPLMEAELTKEEIRALSKAAGLSSWNMPSSPCLSSRIPYGEIITEKKLRMTEAAEDYIKEIGFNICRVRTRSDDIAVIEVEKKRLGELKKTFSKVEKALKNIGYKKIIIDEEGFKSGKLNAQLK